MDQDEELARFKWILYAGIFFLITGIYSFSELRYALFGKIAEARVISVDDHVEARVNRRMFSTQNVRVFAYEFQDVDGTLRREQDEVSESWPRPEGETIKVQYLSGSKHSSRLAGNVKWVAIIGFLVSLSLLVFAIWRLVRMANDPFQKTAGRRGR